MSKILEKFQSESQLPNEQLLAFETNFGQTLILTDKRVVFYESMKLLSNREVALAYSDITSVEQKLTRLKVDGKAIDFEFTGQHMKFLGKAIQQLKFDPEAAAQIKNEFEQLTTNKPKSGFGVRKTLKYAFYTIVGLPVIAVILGILVGPQPEPENQMAFAEESKLSDYTAQCQAAFREAEHIEEHSKHTIIKSKYYVIPEHNPWHFQMDGSDIAITGTMQITNSLFKKGHQEMQDYFYCGIDRASGKINYLNSIGYEKEVSRIGDKGIKRRPVQMTAAMKKHKQEQERQIEADYEEALWNLYFGDCQSLVTRLYPQAEFRLLSSNHVAPRKNKKDNWVTAVSWFATNAFGVDVHNRTWCEYDDESNKRLGYETETLEFKK